MTGHYVWIDGRPYSNSWASADQVHDYQLPGWTCYRHKIEQCQSCPQPSVRTPRGCGFLGEIRPNPHGRYATTRYEPYVVLADGTVEELMTTPNYLTALGWLSERLRKETPNP